MARLFLLTLGFHENFAIRRLTRSSSSGGDVVLVVSIRNPVRAVVTAYESVKGIASRMGLVVRDLYTLDPEDVAGSLSLLLEEVESLVRAYSLRRVVIDATGGVKPLSLITFLLALILASKGEVSVDYYIQSETSMEYEVHLDDRMLRLFTSKLSREELRVLAGVLHYPGESPSRLAELLGVNYKTLLNKLGKLKKIGLAYQRGRGGGVYPTPWARVALTLSGSKVE